jgi:uncharacterized OB-fold protein
MSGLDTTPSEFAAFTGSIDLPYKLTPGRSASVFIAELANQTIVGSRCAACHRVLVPAQDFCGSCGSETFELLEMAPTATLQAFTETDAGLIALVRVDGADTDMTHRIVDTAYDNLVPGQRLVARWSPEPTGSMLDLAGFVPSDDVPVVAPRPLKQSAEPLLEQPYRLQLTYRHAYGPFYGRLFDELSTSRRILGVRCPSCKSVLLPPRAYCEVCMVRTEEWVDLPDTGRIQGFSVIHLEFVGQARKPPYVYAEIILDGAATRLIHTIGNIDADVAKDRLQPGTRVRAVWRDGEPSGTLEDIDYFEVIDE